MGGKRSDQYNIDPSEAGSTDYKWRREGRSAGDKIPDEEKQNLQSNPHDQPMIPEETVNPALRELRERKQASHLAAERHHADGEDGGQEEGGRQGGQRGRQQAGQQASGGQTADERVDEASEESFPASDPPQQP